MTERSVRIPCGPHAIDGDLAVPAEAAGLVIFAHGSGSSRFSSRNRAVAQALQRRGLATLLLDLLTPEEAARDEFTREHRFDIPLLARRLACAVDWALADPALPHAIGLFGASTGAGAALIAAAERPDAVRAVVSRGGRPDLAGDALPRVAAPTLLLVGELDAVVIGLNDQARRRLPADTEARLVIVPGATHLFEEPGTLERVMELAGDWFDERLAAR